MFKNYMHNELGITKEDIREWIDEAVRSEVSKMINNSFRSFDIHQMAKTCIKETLEKDYDIRKMIHDKIMKSLTFKE